MEVRVNKDGTRSVRVVYRSGGRRRVKTFRGDAKQAKKAARLFSAQIAQHRIESNLPQLDRGTVTLEEFAERFWEEYAEEHLSPRTRSDYADLLVRLILPHLGGVRLRDLSVSRITTWKTMLRNNGTGIRSVAKAMTCLQSILTRATEWGELDRNPVAGMKRPKTPHQEVKPMPPSEVEAVRAVLMEQDKLGGAALVSVMAYAGLRPQEALALTWDHVRDRTLLVAQKVELETGTIVPGQKTRQRADTVDMIAPVKWDLGEWRKEATQRLVFPNFRAEPWNRWDWGNWRRRVWTPALEAAGVEYRRPYDLRHSFASLMIQEGASPAEVAEQMRNTIKVTLDTYTHLFSEFRDEGRTARIAGRVNEARTGRVEIERSAL